MTEDFSNLSRPKHPIPEFVRKALKKQGLMDDYKARPAYKQNDYIGWINRARRQVTKERRLNQMIEELERGGVYMNMDHPPSRKS